MLAAVWKSESGTVRRPGKRGGSRPFGVPESIPHLLPVGRTSYVLIYQGDWIPPSVEAGMGQVRLRILR
jgi:hypothetical protein